MLRKSKGHKPARKITPRAAEALFRAAEALEPRQMLSAHIVGSTTVYSTIQAAVDAASAGATITVDPGTYAGQTTVNKKLTIQGAQAGVDARNNSRGTSESIVTGTSGSGGISSGFKITASDVTIDGFTVQGQTTNDDQFGAGIAITSGVSGTHIINDIVQNNTAGLYLANASASDAALIQHDVFKNNNNPADNAGRGIYTDGGITGGTLQNVTIDGNYFTLNLGVSPNLIQAAIGLEGSVTSTQQNINITNNVFDTNGKAVLALNVTNLLIDGNVVGNHYDTDSGALRFEGGDHNVTITHNNIYADGANAIRIDQKGSTGTETNFVINNNNIYDNGLETAHTGLLLVAGQYSGTLNATNNYWGASNGPGGDYSGSGDQVTAAGDSITISPYATTYAVNPEVPYYGLNATVTSNFNAVDFDHGLDGVGYHDTDTTNSGDNYRPNVGVDIGTTTDAGSQYDVINTAAGEWLQYTVTVPASGTYTLNARVASASTGGKFHINVDGTNVTGSLSLPSTGGASTWQTMTTSNVSLTAGTHILRLSFDTNNSSGNVGNWHWLRFDAVNVAQLPNAPGNLSATAQSATSVKLTWTDNSSNETGFIIERQQGSSGVWTSITTTAANVQTYTDATATAYTAYTYRVRATNASGDSANVTATVTTPVATGTVFLSDMTPVSSTNGWGPVEKDQNVGGSGTNDGTIITLNGVTYAKGLGTNAISDIVYNVNGQYGTFQSDVGVDDHQTSNGTVIFQVFADGVKVFDSGTMTPTSATQSINLNISGVQQLRLHVDDAGDGIDYDWGDWAGARVIPPALSAPATLTAAPISGTEIDLAWSEVSGEAGFKIERSTDGTTFTSLATVASSVLTYKDTTVSGTTKYYYRVKATNSGGDSLPSTVASTQPVQPPAAPANLTVTPITNTEIDLAWNDVTGEAGFKIERSIDGTTFTSLASVGTGVLTYKDLTVSGSGKFYYRVKATNNGGDSLPSNVANTAPVQPPAAPGNLTVAPISGTEIDLAWGDVAGETGFKIERSIDGTTFTSLTSLGAGVLTYKDTSVSGTTKYYYRVKATGAGGDSLASNVASTQSVQPPAAPANLTTTPISGNEIDLGWGDVANEIGFKVERSTDGTNFAPLASVGAGVLTYKDTSVSGTGVYYYRVKATNSGGDSLASNVASTQVIQPPSAPANLTATPISGSEIDLAWGDVANESGFKIERSTDGTNFMPLTSVSTGITSYKDLTVAGTGVYYYRVTATNSGGDSLASNVASTQVIQPPSAPANLAATPISGTEIDLAWGDVANESGFKIERSTDNVNFTQIGTVSAGVLTYSDTTVSGMTAYYYRVRATNSGGDSAPSNVDRALPVQPPHAPANLTATPISGTEIDLAWNDVSKETGFNIERSTDGTNFTALASVGAGVLTYNDTSVAGSGIYYFRVEATNSGGVSEASNVASSAPVQPPVAPANLVATPISGTEIDLTWGDVANENGFKIERSTDGTNFTALASVGAGVTSYSDLAVVGSGTYFYRVRAMNIAGDSAASNVANTQSVQPPIAPANLTATPISGTEIDLAWGDVANESGFKIERSTDGTNYSLLANVGAGVTTYGDLAVAGAGTYFYRVEATNSGGDSAASNVASSAPVQPPNAPGNLTVTPISGTEIDLAWGDVSSETGYRIERSTDGTNFTPLGTVGADVTSYHDTDVSGAVVYSYRIIATNSGGDSAASNIATSAPVQPPNAPANLAATPISGTEIDLAWGDVSNENGFTIERSTDGANFTAIASVAAGVTSYQDTGVSGSGTYYYRVEATNIAGASQPSNVASSAPVQPPVAPGNLVATPVSGTEIDLTWNDVSGETGYQIERSTDGTNFNALTTVAANATSYHDASVSGSGTYFYRVIATNSGGDSAASNVASSAPVQPPVAPANLVATPISGSEIDLTWGDVANENGFKIERSTDGTNFTALASVGAGVTAYQDSTVSGTGTYFYRVIATNIAGDSAASNVASTQSIQPPIAPANLTATPISGTEIDLAWGDVSGETGYRIERSTDGTNFSTLASLGANVTSYHDTGVSGSGVYSYRVIAINSGGDSLASNVASSAPVQPPAAPANLVATPISGTEIDLAWGDVDGESGFKIERSTDGTNYSLLASVGAGVTSYHDITVAGSGIYYYRVRATDSAGDSAASNVASSAPVQPPSAPANLTATPVSGTEIDLAWDDVATETGFKIERSTDGVHFSPLTTVGANVTSYHDLSVFGSTTFYYRVKATNFVGDSQPSNVAASAPLQPPIAPAGLTATPISGTEIDLSWGDVSGETGYRIERSTDGTNFSPLASVGADVTSYHDTSVSGSGTYSYRVIASNTVGDSPASNVAAAEPLQPPAAPTNLTATSPSSSEIDLSWDNVSGESGFKIERSTDGTNYSPLATVGADVTSYADTSASGTGLFYYRVYAYNAEGNSDYSNIAQTTVKLTPSAPANLAASPASPTQINLTWSDVANETGFGIERSTDGTNFSPLATVGAGVTSYSDMTVSGTGTYYYRVYAINAGGDSDDSNVAHSTPQVPPASPSNLVATSASPTQINLTWSDVSDETGFGIERSTDGVNFSPLVTVGAGVTSYQDTTVSGTTLYSYRVYAINAAGDSGDSNVASATPVLPPAAPGNFVASPASPTQISLSWSDVANEAGFEIERSYDGIHFSALASVDAGVTSYVDPTVSGTSTFYYRVYAYNAAGNSDYSSIASSTPVLPPGVPTNLAATPASPTEIDLSWTDVAGETGYGIERSNDGTNFYPLTTVGAGVSSYHDLSVSGAGTFYYRVYAFNAAGDSDYSNTAGSTAKVAPAAPANLSAAPASPTQINLAWSDVANETGYGIERSTDGVNFSPLTTVGADVTSYADTSVAGSGTYYYRVYAIGTYGNSGDSNIAHSTPLLPPSAPSGLGATPISSTEIDLSWTDVTGETGYGIERSTDGTNFLPLATVGADVTSYQDTSVSGTGLYYYRVYAINAAGSSGDSNVTSSTPALPPDAPSNLTALPISGTEIDLMWSGVANETGYGIERSTDGVHFSPLTTVGAGVTSYHDTSVSGTSAYSYRVYAFNVNGNSGDSNVVSTTPALPPAAPSGLGATAVSGTRIDLAWSDVANETGFGIERSTDGVNFSPLTTVGAGVTSYQDASVSGTGVYYYRVYAINGVGDSGYSNVASTAPVQPPSAPANLAASPASPTQINLTWSDVANETGFGIERSTDGTNFSPLATVGAGVTSYSDMTVSGTGTYYYRVYAINAGGDSDDSNVAHSTPQVPPASPSNLVATSASPTQINLTWSDVSDETGFGIERSTDGVNFSPLVTVGAGVTSYQDTTVSGTTLYSYRVYAINAAGDSGDSNVASATPVLPPNAPGNLTASPISATEIDLSWSSVANETGYGIERSTDGVNFSPLATVSGAATSYHDAGVSGTGLYYYRVYAINDAGNSGDSNIASSTPALPPAAPSNLAASPISGTEIDLSWLNVSDETGYRIERSTDGTHFTLLASVGANVTSYQDATVSGSGTFYYRVYAVNANGNSGDSNVASTMPVQPTSAPGNLTASPISASEIDLAWSDVSGESGYGIERSTDGVNFVPLASVGANVTSYHDTSVSGTGTYYYRVYATNAGGNSADSNVASTTPELPPGAPSNLVAMSGSPTQIHLTWSDVTNETGFGIERSTDGVNFTALASVGAGVTSYADSTVSGTTTYYYRVYAINDAGNSGDSNVAKITANPPAAPGNLSASPASATQINLSWSDVAGETGFGIERSTDGVNFSPLAAVGAGVTNYQDTGVSGTGTYYYRVYAINDAGHSGNSNVAHSTPVLPPAAPGNLAAGATSTSQIHLTWNDTAGETGFVIERSANGTSGWAQVGNVTAGTLGFNDTGLSAATPYYYRVYATGAAGNSDYSNIASATTVALPPSAPTNLSASAASSTQINLTWTDTSSNETGFIIERSLDGSTNWALVTTTAANATSYSNTGLSASTKYYYRVRATSGVGDSAESNTASATTLSSTALPLPWVDSDIGAVGVTGSATYTNGVYTLKGGGVDIWGTADSFNFVYQTLNGNGQIIARITGVTNTNSGAHGGVMIRNSLAANSQEASLVFTATNGMGFVTRTTAGASSNVTIVNGTLTLPYWLKLVRSGNTLTAYRSTNGTTWISAGSATISMGTTVYVGLVDCSKNTSALCTTTFDNVSMAAVPGTPTAPTANAASSSEIDLTWSAADGSASGYKIERSTDGTNFTQIAITVGSATTYADTSGLSAGTKYYYRIRATSAAGDSGYTAIVNATTLQSVPAAPSTLAATANGTNSISLTWVDKSNNETGFKIERSLDGLTNWTLVTTTAANTMAYTDSTGLSSGTQYFYRVRATNGVGDSANSNVASATTAIALPPSAPTNLSASAASSTQINLTWTDTSTDETGFIIERSLDGSTNWALVTTTAANVMAYSDASGLAAGTKYYYRVRATNAVGDSGNSNIANATTLVSTALPSPWADSDIGAVGVTGSATYTNGVYTLKGGGVDIWGTADSFNFVYQTLSGNGQIIARITGVSNTNDGAHGGVMIRSSLAADAQEASLVYTATNGMGFVTRKTAGASSGVMIVSGTLTLPYYLKLIRNGNTLTAYRSSNGTTWTQVGSATISMGTTVYVGLVDCSKNTSALCTTTFDRVLISSSTSTTLAAPTNMANPFNDLTPITQQTSGNSLLDSEDALAPLLG